MTSNSISHNHKCVEYHLKVISSYDYGYVSNTCKKKFEKSTLF